MRLLDAAGYEDFDENEEEMGYFASYAKAKK